MHTFSFAFIGGSSFRSEYAWVAALEPLPAPHYTPIRAKVNAFKTGTHHGRREPAFAAASAGRHGE